MEYLKTILFKVSPLTYQVQEIKTPFKVRLQKSMEVFFLAMLLVQKSII